MKEKELLAKLKGKAIFSIQDIERYGGFSKAYAKLVLNMLVKRKEILRVTKNKYAIQKDIYVIASNIATPCYISFWSASSYYGYTEQILSKVYVATTRQVRNVEALGYRISFCKIKKFFGYKKLNTENGEIFMVKPEKLLIDAVEYQKQMGNFDEIIKAFENAEISRKRMVEYLKRTHSMSAIKRVGYLLELTRGIDISKYFSMDRNYILVNKFSKKYRTTSVKWRV